MHGFHISQIAIGFVLGILSLKVYRFLDSSIGDSLRFGRAGFTYETPTGTKPGMVGWLSRDPNNDDWIFWHEKRGVMLRSGENDTAWQISGETKEQCLRLGRAYKEHMGF